MNRVPAAKLSSRAAMSVISSSCLSPTPMKFMLTAIPSAVIIDPAVYGYEHGSFLESLNESRTDEGLSNPGLPMTSLFVRDNHTCPYKAVLRGLHYQSSRYPMCKLVLNTQDASYDVTVGVSGYLPIIGSWVSMNIKAAASMQRRVILARPRL